MGNYVQDWTTAAGLGRPKPPAEVVPNWKLAGGKSKHEGHMRGGEAPAANVPWALEKAAPPESMPAARPSIALDQALAAFAAVGLEKPYDIALPQGPKGAFTATSHPPRVEETRTVYLDQYSGKVLGDVGFAQYGPAAKAIEWGIAVRRKRAPKQVLLQMPGVAQHSFGQVHVRSDHANVQFRINGVQLPEGLSVFGQALESRFARSISLLTGALPAQYGFQTAGVLDIQTKTGLTNPGFALSMYGGSFNWLQPSFEYGGREGPVDWFLTRNYLGNDRGIENPAATFNAIHDSTQQFHGFSYMSGIIDPDTRVSVIGGAFNGRFQIPNNPGKSPSLGLNVLGATSFNSNLLNEVQHEATQFGVCRCKNTSAISICKSPPSYATVFIIQPGRDRRSSIQRSDPLCPAFRSGRRYSGRCSWRINDSHGRLPRAG
jgi:hypothetical protein